MTNPLIVRKADLPALVGLSARQVQRLEAAGTFPPRIVLGRRAVGWRFADLEAWVADRADASAAER